MQHAAETHTVHLDELSVGETRFAERTLGMPIEEAFGGTDEEGNYVAADGVSRMDLIYVFTVIAVRRRDGLSWDEAERVAEDTPVTETVGLMGADVVPPPVPATPAG